MRRRLLLIISLCWCGVALTVTNAHGCIDDDFCSQQPRNPDVCSSKKHVETFDCKQEPGETLQVCKGNTALNKQEQEDKPYVVLVSLDGFRWDYPEKCGASHLLEMAKEGASAPKGMIPSYPSLTFPNHYTIVTGLYPAHHGIVANNFYEPSCATKPMKRYSLSDPESYLDGRWYGGIPLWSLAEKQGMRSACLFWPGSEARIAGERPAYFLRFKDDTSDEARIEQVGDWLREASSDRPHFITMYYSNVDHKGHEFGPDSQETCEAVKYVDGLIGKLRHELSKAKLHIDLIVLSDHGMTTTVAADWVELDRYADLSDFTTQGALLYARTPDAAAKAYEELDPGFTFSAYRFGKVLEGLHYDGNPRIGDPVIVATGPYGIEAQKSGNKIDKGTHGYDPHNVADMKAIFYAVGPDIRSGFTIDDPFENIHVYPLIAKILGLKFCPIDGKLDVLENILR